MLFIFLINYLYFTFRLHALTIKYKDKKEMTHPTLGLKIINIRNAVSAFLIADTKAREMIASYSLQK